MQIRTLSAIVSAGQKYSGVTQKTSNPNNLLQSRDAEKNPAQGSFEKFHPQTLAAYFGARKMVLPTIPYNSAAMLQQTAKFVPHTLVEGSLFKKGLQRSDWLSSDRKANPSKLLKTFSEKGHISFIDSLIETTVQGLPREEGRDFAQSLSDLLENRYIDPRKANPDKVVRSLNKIITQAPASKGEIGQKESALLIKKAVEKHIKRPSQQALFNEKQVYYPAVPSDKEINDMRLFISEVVK